MQDIHYKNVYHKSSNGGDRVIKHFEKIFNNVLKHYTNVIKSYKNKEINLYDKINIARFELTLFFALIGGGFYAKGMLRSIRLGIGDSITISSIFLGILGVFIGVLIGEKKNSKFFKAASEAGKDNWYPNLMRNIERQFLVNVLFIAYTFLYDFLPPFSHLYIKTILIAVWIGMFILTLWGVFYVVDTIVNICISESRINDTPLKRHK